MRPYIAVLSFFLFVLGSCRNSDNIPFEKEKWKQTDLRTRGRMVDNLLKQNLLIGKTKNEVTDLLGEPDDENNAEQPFYISYRVDLDHIYMYDMIILIDSSSRKTVDVLLDD